MDTVRGNSAFLFSNHTNVESSTPYNDGNSTLSFDFVRDGVSFTDSNYNYGELYFNNRSYIAWCWKAGGNKGTFNVDDVGYANASDVNMNVGALNSSLYNTSRVWSSGIANSSGDFDQPATNAFDGDHTNQLQELVVIEFL